MARIKPLYITVETVAGGEVGPVRILAVDKIAAERTCRAQHWPYEDTPAVHFLMGYHALRRAGLANVEDFDQFQAEYVDFALSNTLDEDDDDDDEGDEDPTRAGGSGF